MWRYGQYCPLAHALEILGDRWTLLIIRDLMKGIGRFNELERGLPGISRGLLASRLRRLQDAGVVERIVDEKEAAPLGYGLTEAGEALGPVVEELWSWGMAWAFPEPTLEELNSPLLMWRLHKEVHTHLLPSERIVVQFSFHGIEHSSYWLLLKPDDVSLCLTDPGFGIDIIVMADLKDFFMVWSQRIDYRHAIESRILEIDGSPLLVRAFATWFPWSGGVEQPMRPA